MRVPHHVVEARRAKLASLIARHRYLPIHELCRQLGVSEATARRDLATLARHHKIKRTHGGALAEFNERFPSFHERKLQAIDSKKKVAKSAARLLQPGGTYFLDSGTTLFALAEAFCESGSFPVTIVTPNLPAAELLSSAPNVSIFLTAGELLGRQSMLLGETTQRSLGFWRFDIAFLGAEAADVHGIWNSQEIIVQQQLVAIRRATRVVYCLDASKIGKAAPFLLKNWNEVDILLTDACEENLQETGILANDIQFLSCDLSSPCPDLLSSNPSFPIHCL